MNFQERVEAILDSLGIGKSYEFQIPFTFDTIYSNRSTSFSYVPLQVLLPKISNYLPSGTKVEIVIEVSYNITGAANGEVQLYNYTNSTPVTGSVFSIPNATWVYAKSGVIDVTAYEGKAVRIGTRRVGGIPTSQVQIESASLKVKIS
ncbi:MAG: hypothetical protein KC589_09210 [Nanoarchaeota archaeon]|nr:hypothetical protein [Nanoarchaeota archaeon]